METAEAALRRLHETLRRKKRHLTAVHFGTPCAPADVAAWEAANKTQLPPSFKRFLLDVGSAYVHDDADNCEYWPTLRLDELSLAPDFIVQYDDDYGGELTNRALAFQGNCYREDHFVFDLQTRSPEGECAILELDPSDEFSFPSDGVTQSFDEHIVELVAVILAKK